MTGLVGSKNLHTGLASAVSPSCRKGLRSLGSLTAGIGITQMLRGRVRPSVWGEPLYSMVSRRHLKKLSMIILATLSINRWPTRATGPPT